MEFGEELGVEEVKPKKKREAKAKLIKVPKEILS